MIKRILIGIKLVIIIIACDYFIIFLYIKRCYSIICKKIVNSNIYEEDTEIGDNSEVDNDGETEEEKEVDLGKNRDKIISTLDHTNNISKNDFSTTVSRTKSGISPTPKTQRKEYIGNVNLVVDENFSLDFRMVNELIIDQIKTNPETKFKYIFAKYLEASSNRGEHMVYIYDINHV